MKNFLKKAAFLMAVVCIVAVSAMNIAAAGSIVATMDGSAGAEGGTWDGAVPREASGSSLIIDSANTGDVYDGLVFEGVAPGIYKIGHYITVTELLDETRMTRVSPKVSDEGIDVLRIWADFKYENVKAVMDATGSNKIIFVTVIVVPEGYNQIDAGFYPQSGGYNGTVDRVVLASADYDFATETEYKYVEELSFFENGEGDYALIMADEGEWTASSALTQAPAETPVETPVETPAETTPSDTAPEAPQTSDAAVVCGIAVLAAACGAVIAIKKRK